MEGVFVEFDLWRAKGFVSVVSQEKVPLNPNDIRVYCYIRNEVEILKNKYLIMTQEDISKAVGISLSSGKRSLKKLISHGVIECEKRKWHNYENYRYLKVNKLRLY